MTLKHSPFHQPSCVTPEVPEFELNFKGKFNFAARTLNVGTIDWQEAVGESYIGKP